jgi:hypothetical protein
MPRQAALVFSILASMAAVTGAFNGSDLMAVGRAGAIGVLLEDGRVLIAGGWDGAVPLASTEVYDPATGQFIPGAATMAMGRAGADVLSLQGGQILIVGGHDGFANVATPELFDGSTFTPTDEAALADPAFDIYTATNNAVIGRRGHTATPLADGRVLIAGGVDENNLPIVSAELYNPITQELQPTGGMLSPRADHRAVRLDTGHVFIVGGRDVSGPLNTVERYDPETGSFASLPGLAHARSAPVVIALATDRIFVGGGTGLEGPLATAEIYDVPSRPAPQSTTTELTFIRMSSLYGQAITYHASVSPHELVAGSEVRFLDGGTYLLGSATLDASGRATLTTTLTPVGTRTITAVFDGTPLASGSTSNAVFPSVTKTSATATLTVSPLTRQYSDVETFTVTVTGAYGGPPADGVDYRVGTQPMNSQPVPFKSMGNGVWKSTHTTQLLETSPAGQLRPTGTNKIAYATLSGVSPNYSIPNPTAKAFLLTKEDSALTFIPPAPVLTTKGTGKAVVKLRVTVNDLDIDIGNLGLAQVTFINRTDNVLIGTVNVSQNAPGVGEAAIDWNVDIGNASAKTYIVQFVATNYYASVMGAATVVVTRQR